MRTSEEIYHRVRWDPRFDPARFTLGIMVRGAEPKRLPLPSFVPGGDIPWHRVLFVEADGEVVWDRTTGVDRLDETSAGRVRSSSLLPSFSARTVSGKAAGMPGPTLRVLTWNTLWDRYDSDLIDTAGRRPLLLAELARADADVIALQEVEPELYDMLALEGYAISDGTDVAAHGLVLLSRLPVLEAGHHVLSPHKGVAAVVVRTAAGPVAVLATHLTSDHHPYGAARRVDELSKIVVGLADIACPVVLMGDFNGGPIERLALVDAWSAVRGDETPTFDPSANPLAAVSSLTGRASRLDRVLVRGVRPVAATLLGTVAPFVSDHYGVAVSLEVADGLAEEPESGDEVARRVAAAIPDGVVHVVGSRRMGCANAGADLDLVAVVPGGQRVVVPGAERVRPVVGARVPGLRFRLGGLAVDLTLVTAGDHGDAAAIALSAVSDAEAVLAAVGGRHAEFAALAKEVKAWAAARGLDSAPHGGLPGIAWAVLAARTVRESATAGLVDFFGQWAAWDWRKPVTLLGDTVPATGDPVTVMTPSAPIRSCTEQVTGGMRDLVTAELYAAWEGTDPVPRHAAWAIVTVAAVRGEDLDVTLGRLRGRVRALLALLPADAHAWPRPFERTDSSARYAIGLGAEPPDRHELAAAVELWGELPGVRVEWTAMTQSFPAPPTSPPAVRAGAAGAAPCAGNP
jgi:endonuclease/exonuclease/phosphatase family metal-dependent hydrolase/uncharacterized protein (UPF0248 family)